MAAVWVPILLLGALYTLLSIVGAVIWAKFHMPRTVQKMLLMLHCETAAGAQTRSQHVGRTLEAAL